MVSPPGVKRTACFVVEKTGCIQVVTQLDQAVPVRSESS
jgi:hypothetical protein